jgi:ABC-2 type transport system permease protein
MTFALILMLWLIDALGQGMPGSLGAAVSHLSLLQHFTDFTEGIFDTAAWCFFSATLCWGCTSPPSP